MSKISIALCTFNGAPYLSQQLDSFLSQSRRPDEIIICDDRSLDPTPSILKAFAKTAPFDTQIFINDHTLGVTQNFEKAINACSGDVIALSDQDDVWHYQKLEQLEKVFSSQTDIGAVFSNAEIVDASLSPLGYTMWQRIRFPPGEQQRVHLGDTLAVLLKHYIATGATLAFRAAFKPVILPIPDFWYHDTWICLLIAALSTVSIIETPLIQYRQHSQNELGGIQKGLRQQIAEALKIKREDYYTLEIKKYHALCERLDNLSGGFTLTQNNRLLVQEKCDHLQTRASLHKNRLLRIPVICSEIGKLRYQRYARNWGSIAMDFFFR
jgi:glycosyltransferase involved in cell wall biosynthesis